MTGTSGKEHASIMLESRTAELAAAAELLSAVADPVRLQLIGLLSAGPSCVCDLQADVPIPGNLLSDHLKVLREAGLIVGTRRGRWIDYALTEGALDRLHAALPDPALVARQLVVVR